MKLPTLLFGKGQKFPSIQNKILFLAIGGICLIAFVLSFVLLNYPANNVFDSLFTPPPDGYLHTSSIELDFIQYTDQNNQLIGNYTVVKNPGNNTLSAQTTSITFTGTLQGSSLALIFHEPFGYQASTTGHIDGRNLVLQVPQDDGTIGIETFTGVTVDQYNQTVKQFQQNIYDQYQQVLNSQATATTIAINNQATVTAEDATQTAISAAQQNVTDANQSLSSALESLKSDDTTLQNFSEQSTLKSFESDWQTMQNDLSTVQKDANAGCGENNGNYNAVNGDVNAVSGDKNAIAGDDNALSGDENTYNADLSQAQQDAKAVSSDWNTLQAAIANNPTGLPQAKFSKKDVDTALTNDTTAQSAATSIWQDAQAKAKEYDQEADATLTKAQNIYNNMHCS